MEMRMTGVGERASMLDGRRPLETRVCRVALVHGCKELRMRLPCRGVRTQPSARKSNVLGVKLRLEPSAYTGQCPEPIKLIADITTDGPGKVWYSFLAGAVAKNGPSEGTVEFTAAGTKTVLLEGTIT